MMSKFIVKIIDGSEKGKFFKAASDGVTCYREDAHVFTYIGMGVTTFSIPRLLVDEPNGLTYIDVDKAEHRLIPIEPYQVNRVTC